MKISSKKPIIKNKPFLIVFIILIFTFATFIFSVIGVVFSEPRNIRKIADMIMPFIPIVGATLFTLVSCFSAWCANSAYRLNDKVLNRIFAVGALIFIFSLVGCCIALKKTNSKTENNDYDKNNKIKTALNHDDYYDFEPEI